MKFRIWLYPLILVVSELVLLIIGFIFYEFINKAVEKGYIQTLCHLDEDCAMVLCTFMADCVVIVLAWKVLKMIKTSEIAKRPNISTRGFLNVFLFTFIGIFGIQIFTDLLNLTDFNEDIKQTPIIVIYMCVIAPILEELFYRGAIQGWFQRNAIKPVYAIIISSIIFGVSHLNPAQIPFATLMGIMLGILYWKTGSLVIPILIHISNNTVSYLLSDPSDDSELTFSDLFGGTIPAVVIMVLCCIACCTFYYKFIQTNNFVKKVD